MNPTFGSPSFITNPPQIPKPTIPPFNAGVGIATPNIAQQNFGVDTSTASGANTNDVIANLPQNTNQNTNTGSIQNSNIGNNNLNSVTQSTSLQPQVQSFTTPSGMQVDANGNPVGTQSTGLGGGSNPFSQFQNDPQTQQYIQQQNDIYTRLAALQQQLAQSNVPTDTEMTAQNQANQVQLQLNQLYPQQFLQDNPSLVANGATEGGIEQEIAQQRTPLAASLANFVLAKSAAAQQRQYTGMQLGAEATGLANQAQLGQQLRQATMFGGLPSDVASQILQKQLFPPFQVATNIAGQPIAITQQPGGGFIQEPIGQTGIGGQTTQSTTGTYTYSATGSYSDPSQGIVGGINLTGGQQGSYAADPNYASEVGTIYNKIGSVLNNPSDPNSLSQYIQSVAPNSPITGDMILASSSKYGIDPQVLAAGLQQESQFGTKGIGAQTNDPGNVGNTGTQTQNYPNVQAGIDAMAQQYAARSVGNQQQGGQTSQGGQPPSSVNIGGLPVQVDHMVDGTSYINSDKVDPKVLPYAQAVAPSQYGIPVLSSDDVTKARAIDQTYQNLNNISQAFSGIQSGGLFGRLVRGPLNYITGNVLESNSSVAAFDSYRTAAINAIQALAGGSGSGFRLTQGEIDTATSNLPTIFDNTQTAQTKLDRMNTYLNQWKQEILPGSKPFKIQGGIAGGSSSGSQPSQVVYQGQTYNVDANGDMTVAQ